MSDRGSAGLSVVMLTPVVLAEKEGLALINGTDGMLGMLVMALVDIQGWSEVPRGTPLFESLFVFENVGGMNALGAGRGGLEIRGDQTVGAVGSRTGYPLTAIVAPGGASVT